MRSARALWRRHDNLVLSERQIKSVIYMYSHDYPLAIIMERFHIADQQVRKIAKEAGLKMRGTK